MVIQSAVVPVAGLGTRLLPATKSQPKEMLPVARKPIVQYVVEELVKNGIEQILFVTGRNKASIENHFDYDPELVRALTAANKKDLLEEIGFEELQAHFFYTRQRLQRGLGDAILCGENFAGEEPFLVALGDSILGLHASSKVVTRLAAVFESKRASCVIAVEEVPREETRHYGIVQPEPGVLDSLAREATAAVFGLLANINFATDADAAPSAPQIQRNRIFNAKLHPKLAVIS
jgi:UTP--glucose-1-phosphate uridylyltransferase